MLLYPIGKTEAAAHAADLLKQSGIPLIYHPSPEVTHLLLDIRPGQDPYLSYILSMLPPSTIVIGGNVNLPEHKVWNFLEDETYLARNAAITAHCAIKSALPHLQATLADTPTLVIGWGRIGKCLARLLRAMDCPVTVAARKETDRAQLQALGYTVQDTTKLNPGPYGLIFNTVPAPVLPEAQTAALKIELASTDGIAGPDVITARGLPGKLAPLTSGKLIAETILRYHKEETT